MGLQRLIRLIRPGKLQIQGKGLIRLIRLEIQGILRKGLIRLIRVEIQGIPRKGLMRLIRLIRVELQGIPSKGLSRPIRPGKSRNYGNQGVDSIAGEPREFRKPGSSLNRRGGLARISKPRQFTQSQGEPQGISKTREFIRFSKEFIERV